MKGIERGRGEGDGEGRGERRGSTGPTILYKFNGTERVDFPSPCLVHSRATKNKNCVLSVCVCKLCNRHLYPCAITLPHILHMAGQAILDHSSIPGLIGLGTLHLTGTNHQTSTWQSHDLNRYPLQELCQWATCPDCGQSKHWSVGNALLRVRHR